VRIGDGYLGNLTSSDRSTLRFTLPAYLSPCPPEVQVCIQVVVEVKPGSYQVSVTNANGTSNAVTMQVVGR